MYEYDKAIYHKEMQLSQRILMSPSPVEAAKLGRQVKVSYKWYDIRDDVMKDVIKAKICQVEVANDTIRNVGKNKNFVYVDKFDKYWSCGLPAKLANIIDPKNYPAPNILGKMLTDL
jgi:ribA/ribD-fused uncharacterized protein